jgi:hypothetical protein
LILCRWWIFPDMGGRQRTTLRSACLWWVAVAWSHGLIAGEWDEIARSCHLARRSKGRTDGDECW